MKCALAAQSSGANDMLPGQVLVVADGGDDDLEEHKMTR